MLSSTTLRRSIHRIATRPTFSAGIRWSSYVGDVRCFARLAWDAGPSNGGSGAGGVRGYSSGNAEDRRAPHERLLVLGSGVAGCAAALTAARHGLRVTVLHAGSSRDDCNSYWAQGGIIYRNYNLHRPDDDGQTKTRLVDTPRSLVDDIRVASGYLPPLARTDDLEEGRYTPDDVLSRHPHDSRRCPATGIAWNEDAAWKLAVEGPSRIRQLLLGRRDGGEGEERGCVVPFDRTAGEDALSLCLEASHAAPRIIHHADCTGKAITTHITRAAAAHPLIDFVGDSVVADLLFDDDDGIVIGARVLDNTTRQLTDHYAVHGLVLASGGLAGIYRHSTNPAGFNALGSSVGLALRLERSLSGTPSFSSSPSSSSSIVSDLEYVQFHPTALYLPNEPRFLLTEALRGEGAILRDADGRAFARDYHPRGELAPRDVVARAVFGETQKSKDTHNAYLDITHRDGDWLTKRFPSVHDHLIRRNPPLDFTRDKIPVVPAAHYTCGGVTTDLDGRVTVPRLDAIDTNQPTWVRNLYAAGEAARTGLHGGNRLASTSLLEGLVFGSSAGETAAGTVEERMEEVAETAAEARAAIERRLSRSGARNVHSSHRVPARADEETVREATVLLSHLKSIMWDNVGVVRTPSKLSAAVSDLAAIREEADRLWEGRRPGGAGVEAAALRDAAYAGLAVAEAALANRVSGGAHCIVLEEEEEEKDDRLRKEGESDDEDEGLVVARG